MADEKFEEDRFMKMLVNLKDTQESIEGFSSWCVKARRSAYKMARCWIKVIKKVRIEQKLVLFYLVNDIVQHSAKKGYTELLDKFRSAIKESMPYLKEEKIAYKVQRCLDIWEEREVFNSEYIQELEKLIDMTPVKEDQEIVENFQPTQLCTQIKIMKALEDDSDYKLKTLKENDMDNKDMNEIKARLKDKHCGNDYVAEFEDGAKKMIDYIKAMEREINRRKQVIELLSQGKRYYDSLYGEAEIVATAYTNFGNRVKKVQQRLNEKIVELDTAEREKDESPMPSPDYDAPSPEGDDEMELKLPDDDDRHTPDLPPPNLTSTIKPPFAVGARSPERGPATPPGRPLFGQGSTPPARPGNPLSPSRSHTPPFPPPAAKAAFNPTSSPPPHPGMLSTSPTSFISQHIQHIPRSHITDFLTKIAQGEKLDLQELLNSKGSDSKAPTHDAADTDYHSDYKRRRLSSPDSHNRRGADHHRHHDDLNGRRRPSGTSSSVTNGSDGLYDAAADRQQQIPGLNSSSSASSHVMIPGIGGESDSTPLRPLFGGAADPPYASEAQRSENEWSRYPSSIYCQPQEDQGRSDGAYNKGQNNWEDPVPEWLQTEGSDHDTNGSDGDGRQNDLGDNQASGSQNVFAKSNLISLTGSPIVRGPESNPHNLSRTSEDMDLSNGEDEEGGDYQEDDLRDAMLESSWSSASAKTNSSAAGFLDSSKPPPPTGWSDRRSGPPPPFSVGSSTVAPGGPSLTTTASSIPPAIPNVGAAELTAATLAPLLMLNLPPPTNAANINIPPPVGAGNGGVSRMLPIPGPGGPRLPPPPISLPSILDGGASKLVTPPPGLMGVTPLGSQQTSTVFSPQPQAGMVGRFSTGSSTPLAAQLSMDRPAFLQNNQDHGGDRNDLDVEDNGEGEHHRHDERDDPYGQPSDRFPNQRQMGGEAVRDSEDSARYSYGQPPPRGGRGHDSPSTPNGRHGNNPEYGHHLPPRSGPPADDFPRSHNSSQQQAGQFGRFGNSGPQHEEDNEHAESGEGQDEYYDDQDRYNIDTGNTSYHGDVGGGDRYNNDSFKEGGFGQQSPFAGNRGKAWNQQQQHPGRGGGGFRDGYSSPAARGRGGGGFQQSNGGGSPFARGGRPPFNNRGRGQWSGSPGGGHPRGGRGPRRNAFRGGPRGHW